MNNPFMPPPQPVDPIKLGLAAEKEARMFNAATQSTGVDEAWALEQQKERAELTKWQQDLSEEIALLVHRLKNETLIEGEWKLRKKLNARGQLVDEEPMCSDECIWRIIAMIEPSTSKNLMMSKYDKETILQSLLDLSNAVTLHIIANRSKYKIKMSDLSPIMQIFKTAATPTYFRALGANEKEYLKGIRKDTYLHTKGDAENKAKQTMF